MVPFAAKLLRTLEARVGIEPTHKGFADPFLSRLSLSASTLNPKLEPFCPLFVRFSAGPGRNDVRNEGEGDQVAGVPSCYDRILVFGTIAHSLFRRGHDLLPIRAQDLDLRLPSFAGRTGINYGKTRSDWQPKTASRFALCLGTGRFLVLDGRRQQNSSGGKGCQHCRCNLLAKFISPAALCLKRSISPRDRKAAGVVHFPGRARRSSLANYFSLITL